MDDRDYPERLQLASRLTEPAIRQAIGGAGIRPGSSGLDVGCGLGQQTFWLAEAVGPGGSVVGLDVSAANLAVAQTLVGQGPISILDRPNYYGFVTCTLFGANVPL